MSEESGKLQVTKLVNANLEKVFEAWTDPKIVEKWFCPEGMKAQVHEWDATIGGNYRISMIDGEDVYITNGTFLEIIPLEKLIFSYGWEDENRIETLVTVNFKKQENGTEIILTHEEINQEEVQNHEEGWLSALANLTKQLL